MSGHPPSDITLPADTLDRCNVGFDADLQASAAGDMDEETEELESSSDHEDDIVNNATINKPSMYLWGSDEAVDKFVQEEVQTVVNVYARREYDESLTEVTTEETGRKDVPVEESRERKVNTSRSCFSDSVRTEFVTRMQSKPDRLCQFSNAKYETYCRILNGEVQSMVGKSLTERRTYQQMRRRIRKNYELSGGLLYKKKFKQDEPVVRLRVKTIEQAIDAVDELHASGAHNGFRCTWNKVRKEFHGISSEDVLWLTQRCKVCVLKRG